MPSLRLTTTIALVLAAPLVSASSKIGFEGFKNRNRPQILILDKTVYTFKHVVTSDDQMIKTATVTSTYSKKKYALTVKKVTASTETAIESEVAVMKALMNVPKTEHVVHVKYAKERFNTAVFLTELGEFGKLKGEQFTDDTREFLNLVGDLTQGLNTLRERGVMHRDIKPENLMSTADGYKFFNFASATTEAESDVLIGDPRYMAPEVVGGEKYDAKVDIFSLGVTLHELISGVNPFLNVDGQTAGDYFEVLQNRLSYFRQSRHCVGGMDLLPLNQLICKMTQEDPEKRIELDELIEELEKIQNPQPIAFPAQPQQSNIGKSNQMRDDQRSVSVLTVAGQHPQPPGLRQSSSHSSGSSGSWRSTQVHETLELGNAATYHDASYYEILKVPFQATPEEIRAAMQMLQAKNMDTAKTVKAYDILMDLEARDRYDQQLLNPNF